MEVKSRKNIGDTIYFMSGDIPLKDVVSGISLFTGFRSDGLCRQWQTDKDSAHVTYHTTCGDVREERAFDSKEDLIKSLFDNLDKQQA